MKRFLLFVLLFVCSYAHAQHPSTVVIVVHGTWANGIAKVVDYFFDDDLKWYHPEHVFFETIKRAFGTKVISFTWSGSIHHDERLKAAERLVQLIHNYPPETKIIIVSHSHGSNVGILASKLMGKDQYNANHIHKFYAFGTPVDIGYMPDMDVINYFYHFFSLRDNIQTLGGASRVFPHHERIANIRTLINNEEPGHCELHDPIIARWLPHVHEFLKGGFESCVCAIMRFFEDTYPEHETDAERERLIALDCWIRCQQTASVFRKAQAEAQSLDPEDDTDTPITKYTDTLAH